MNPDIVVTLQMRTMLLLYWLVEMAYFLSHRYGINTTQTSRPLPRVKGVLKAEGSVELSSFSDEIFNESMFWAVEQLLATLFWDLLKVIDVEWARLAALSRNITIM